MTAYLKDYSRMEDESDFQPSKFEVIPMLVNGVVDKINQAKDAQDCGNLAAKGFYLGRATAIIDALRNTLDASDDNQTARDVDNIYSHVDLCLQASVEKGDYHYMNEALEIMEGIANTWEPISMAMPMGPQAYGNEMHMS